MKTSEFAELGQRMRELGLETLTLPAGKPRTMRLHFKQDTAWLHSQNRRERTERYRKIRERNHAP